MKKLTPVIALVLLLAACASFQVSAGKTLASIATSVDAAMQGWAQWVVHGQATPTQENVVRSAYGKYQASMQIATNAYIQACTSGNQNTWQTAYNVLVTNQVALQSVILSFQTSTNK